MGTITPGVPDRPVQYLLTPITQGQLNTWMHTRSLQDLNTAPDGSGGIAVEPDPIRMFTRGIAKTPRVPVPKHFTGNQCTAGA